MKPERETFMLSIYSKDQGHHMQRVQIDLPINKVTMASNSVCWDNIEGACTRVYSLTIFLHA